MKRNVTVNQDLIIRTRRSKGWSQEELALRAEVARTTVTTAEATGQVSPRSARRIANALGLKVEEVILPDESGTWTADVGHQCLRLLELETTVTRKLTDLRTTEGCSRVRLYIHLRPVGSLVGFAEIGGVDDNFRRIRILLVSDVLSQLLMATPGCIRYSRGPSGDVTASAVHRGCEIVAEPPNAVCLIPHDQPALGRDDVTEWMDVALLSNSGDVLGKLSIDSLHNTGRSCKRLDPESVQIWERAKGIAENLRLFFSGPSDGESPSEGARLAAFRYMLLQDQLRTRLANLRCDAKLNGFDRFRLYLTTETHADLFSDFVNSRYWQARQPPSGSQGFVGFVELGGVALLFKEVFLPATQDPCSAMILSAEDLRVREALTCGAPIIFTLDEDASHGDMPKCHVDYFFTPEALERTALREHLDVPLVSTAGELLGKVTCDCRWHNPPALPPLCKVQIDVFRKHAGSIVAAISAARSAPMKTMYDAISDVLTPCDPYLFV